MTSETSSASASTTEAVAAVSQTRDGSGVGRAPAGDGNFAGEGVDFVLGKGLYRKPAEPYQRKPGEPIYRPLKIYALDPSVPVLDGAIATINVPYEPLDPGPEGSLFSVSNYNDDLGIAYKKADLNNQHVLMADGYEPSQSDPRFHQQMVYAVGSNVYAAFRKALGRNLSWGFGSDKEPAKLVLKPHYGEERNAFYVRDNAGGSVCFGYYPAEEKPTDRSMPKGYVFTCLSHDIIVHEVTHALLDGLRARFCIRSGPDVSAFHEAFADLVAVFQRFSYRNVLLPAIQKCRGALEKAELLKNLAQQFGNTTGHKGALRSAIEPDPDHPAQYDPCLEPHELGEILSRAVFDAFLTVYKRKNQRYVRLGTNGSGILPDGDLPNDLLEILADNASKLASQFLTICIRAIDYCPASGLTFGHYLRALITADYDVVPDDPWDYRGALIDAFRKRGIYPRDVANLSLDALLWRPPKINLPRVPELDFAALRFKGDPAHAAGIGELRRQACSLGRFITRNGYFDGFGLARNGDPRLNGDRVELPCIESIRTARRSGPDGQIVFDLVAEITQLRHVGGSDREHGFPFYGGSTVILGPDGNIRYVITRGITSPKNIEEQRVFIRSSTGSEYWSIAGSEFREVKDMFSL